MNRGLQKELSLLSGIASVGCLLGRKKTLAAAFGLVSAGLRMLPTSTYKFENRSVVITGGSRGLGLALARAFLREGAHVTLLARDPDELEQAKDMLLDYFPEEDLKQVLTIPCDVTQPDELSRAFQQTEDHFGHLDVLVNNAGNIAVGPFKAMEQGDFDAQVNLQLNTVVNAVRLVRPYFRKHIGGRIVNISSIGGKISVPHMTPYCAGKFALAGFSEAVAAEMEPHIHVTTVYPGLMRTGSPIQAVFKGDHEKEYAWFTTGDILPWISVSADHAAWQIIEGVRNGDSRVVFPMVSKVGMWANVLFPETFATVMRTVARFMPHGDSPIRKTGAESRGWLEKQLWYKPLKGTMHHAEMELNQHEKFDAEYNLGLEPLKQNGKHRQQESSY